MAPVRIEKVDIRPGVSILSILRHVKYRSWFALAEFVDNSLQSYLQHRLALQDAHGSGFRLAVRIALDAGPPVQLSVKDNAAGIASADYARAFRPAEIPPDQSGLSEFGMGMKSAACWFAPRWRVRTKALGECVERFISFDIDKIVHDQIEELQITERPCPPNAHFTEIVLEDLHSPLLGRTLGKVKEHLTDIYRVFLRDQRLTLVFNGETLVYEDPAILNALFFKDPTGTPQHWRKDIAFDFGDGLSVHGFAALRETGNVSRSGFALFRRGRLIQGSGDEGYRPDIIFGKSNSFRYQRLFGELHLDGFEVSHTKDGFQWDENEQPFLDLLKEELDKQPLPLLQQAEGYRARVARGLIAAAADQAVRGTAAVIEQQLPAALPAITSAPPVDTPTSPLPAQAALASREIQITFKERPWLIRIEVTNDPAEGDWLSIGNIDPISQSPRRLELRMSAAHPFMVRFAQNDPETMEAILRIAAALAIAEVIARDSGAKLPGTIRRNMNDLLRNVLSAP